MELEKYTNMQIIENINTAIVQEQITGNEVKMLIMFKNNKHRLIDFQLSRDCTVLNLLETAEVFIGPNTRVFLVTEAAHDVHYIVDNSRGTENHAYIEQEIKDLKAAIVQKQIKGEEAKMLVIVTNYDQRLITFKLPKEFCTVQDLLTNANICMGPNARVFLVSDPSLGLHYIVEGSESIAGEQISTSSNIKEKIESPENLNSYCRTNSLDFNHSLECSSIAAEQISTSSNIKEKIESPENLNSYCRTNSLDFNHPLECSDEHKTELNDNLAANNTININNYLSNNCLINIFLYLPLKEKLAVELVCKRWRSLKDDLWIENKSLEISRQMISLIERSDKSSLNPAEITNLIFNVLQRSGPYLNYLTVTNDLDLNFETLFKLITIKCYNLIDLKLWKKRSSFKFCEDDDLEDLFANNKKISSISFSNLKIDGKCLLNLNGDLINKIQINRCWFSSKEYLENFVSKLKNLYSLKLVFVPGINDLIIIFNKSNCENIREFSLEPYIDINVFQLYTLLAKQKKFNKLIGTYGRDLFDILPTDLLQEVDLNLNDDNSQSLDRFTNLTSIECTVDPLTDEIIRNLTKCVNLKKLYMSVKMFSLSNEGEQNFSLFQNLETLQIICTDKMTESMLNAVSNYTNLKELIINPRHSNTLKFTFLITKITNLEKLKLYGHCYFSNTFYKKISNLKIQRRDKHSLEIHFHTTCKYDSMKLKKLDKLPLVTFKFDSVFSLGKA